MATQQMAHRKPQRPVLEYLGGKWRLAKWIISHFPKHRTYTEAFGGAASVLLQKPRSRGEVYNDAFGEVVTLFKVLRDQEKSRQLREALRYTPFARTEYEKAYESADDAVEVARRLVIRSYMGHSSESALGARTGFRCDVTYTGTAYSPQWKRYPDTLEAVTERLRGVVVENKEAGDVLVRHDSKETLHYVDPPYVNGTRRGGTYAHEMTDQDHIDLAKVLHDLKGMVILSGYNSSLYEDLYGDWKCKRRHARADHAGRRTECLWLNAAAEQNQKQQSLF